MQSICGVSVFRSFFLFGNKRERENFWSFILARLSEVFVHSAKLGRSLLIEKRVSSHSLSLRQEQDSQLESQEKRRITVNHSFRLRIKIGGGIEQIHQYIPFDSISIDFDKKTFPLLLLLVSTKFQAQTSKLSFSLSVDEKVAIWQHESLKKQP